ncbi:MAG: FecR domain-containing protein [Tannerellaceae bacterium]
MEDKLLQAYYEGEVSHEQSRLITEWLDADEENMKYYQRLCRLQEIVFWRDDLDTILRPYRRNVRLRRISFEAFKVAAIFILGFLLNYGINRTNQEEVAMQEVHVPSGQNAQLLLADGSKVWLNAGSTLTFPTRFEPGKRQVTLEGEGFFEVKADKEKPFIVSTTQYDIRALGTSFNVEAYKHKQSNCFKTALLTGKVEITDRMSRTFSLSPNTQAIQVGDQLVVVPIKNNDYFLWREGIISFDDPMSEVFKKLELHFNVVIDVHNKQILQNKRHCMGKFRSVDGLDHILKVLQYTNHFTYEKDDVVNKIIIK